MWLPIIFACAAVTVVLFYTAAIIHLENSLFSNFVNFISQNVVTLVRAAHSIAKNKYNISMFFLLMVCDIYLSLYILAHIIFIK